MTQIRTHTNAPSTAGRMLDIEVALEVLDMHHADALERFAAHAHLAHAGDLFGGLREQAIDRAVTVLARPGDPSDELEAAYAIS